LIVRGGWFVWLDFFVVIVVGLVVVTGILSVVVTVGLAGLR